MMDRATLERARKAGVEFCGGIPVPSGQQTVIMTVDEVIAFIEDKVSFSAKRLGATVEEYKDWLETGGSARCGGNSKSGKPCRNFISAPIQMEFTQWRELDLSEYCVVHGGPSSHKRY